MIRVFMIGFSKNKGGVEAYISNLCENLDTNRFQVIYDMPEMEIGGKLWVRPQNRHNYLKYYRFWTEFFRVNHFDVVYFNTCDIVGIDMLRFAKKAGVPIRIIHSHSTGIQQKMNPVHEYFEKKNRRELHNFATHFFACSDVAGKWMFDGRDYKIIKNGINLEKYRFNSEYYQKCRSELGINEDLLIGCVGRLSPEKNLFFAVDVFEVLLKKYPEATLLFIGDGELRTELEESVRKRGLEQKIRFLGARDDVNEWMSAIDCLLMPSLFEGLPFVLVEAQAAGVPCVVSSNVSEESNITGTVRFISLDEPKEKWADKLIECAQLEKADNSERLIESGYSIKETAEFVSDIIEKALSEI